MQIREIMTEAVHFCGPDEPLDQVAQRCWDHDLGALPVVEGLVPVAMVTDRDLCMASFTRGAPLHELRARDCMSKTVHTVRADQSAEEALEVMARERVRRLPVVDESGVLRGLVALDDLVQLVTRLNDPRLRKALEMGVLATLARIGRRSPGGPEPVVTLHPAAAVRPLPVVPPPPRTAAPTVAPKRTPPRP
jgi:CBS domain-containing protein